MKPEGNLVADRPAARHCRELFGSVPDSAALCDFATLIAGRIGRNLADGISRLLGGSWSAVCGTTRESPFSEISELYDALAVHAHLDAGHAQSALLASIDGAPVLRMLDRTFGGAGELPEPLPNTLPLSGLLLADKLLSTLANAIRLSLGEAQNDGSIPVALIGQDTHLDQLTTFPAGGAVIQTPITVECTDGSAWTLSLTFPHSTLATLITPRRIAVGDRDELLSIAAEPLASLPVTLTAALIETPLPVSRLASLTPGDVLPVALNRSVPININGRTLAHGLVGDLDDRVALQIVSPSPERP